MKEITQKAEGFIIGRNGLFDIKEIHAGVDGLNRVWIGGIGSGKGKLINGGICVDKKSMDAFVVRYISEMMEDGSTGKL